MKGSISPRLRSSVANKNILQQVQSAQLFIQKVIGMTSYNQENFAIINNFLVAYLAQSIIVVFDVYKNKQVLHYLNPNNKSYRTLKYFESQSLLIACEGNTKQGEIHMFQCQILEDNQIQMQQIRILKGHKYGIKNIELKGDVIISIGDENDKGMLVWDLNQDKIISANLMKNSDIQSVVFLSQKNFELEYITCGSQGHFKKWTLEVCRDDEGVTYKIKEDQKQICEVPKQVGNKITIDQQNQQNFNFQQMILHGEHIYVLCHLRVNDDKQMYKVIQICEQNYSIQSTYEFHSTQQQLTMTLYEQDKLLIGQENGKITVLQLSNLQEITQPNLNWALPPEKSQFQIISQETYDYLKTKEPSQDISYANIIALKCEQDLLVQILDDGMLIIHNIQTKQVARILYSHSDQINDLSIQDYQAWEDQVSFFTGGKDNTLRIWNVNFNDNNQTVNPIEGDLKRVIFMDDSLRQDQDNKNLEELGIKCLSFNQVRNQLAVGDMQGNIRIYQVNNENQSFQQINYIPAHESKIMALEYSHPYSVQEQSRYVQFLLSASNDRMIHIFNANTDEYNLIQTIDVFSSSVVDAKFIKCIVPIKNKLNKVQSNEKQLRIYASTADKFLLCYKYSESENKFQSLPKDLNKNKINALGLTNDSIILGKDQGYLEIKSIESGKQIQQVQNIHINQGLSKQLLEFIKLDVAQDNYLLGLCDKEKSLQIRDVRQISNILSRVPISDLASSLKFTSDNKYLLCSSLNSKETGGGIIYIFKVEDKNSKIKEREKQIALIQNKQNVVIVSQSDEDKVNRDGFSQSQQNKDSNRNTEVPIRKFEVKEDLYNTWAKSTQQEDMPIGRNQSMIQSIDVNKLSQEDTSYMKSQSYIQTKEQYRPRQETILEEVDEKKDIDNFIDDLISQENQNQNDSFDLLEDSQEKQNQQLNQTKKISKDNVQNITPKVLTANFAQQTEDKQQMVSQDCQTIKPESNFKVENYINELECQIDLKIRQIETNSEKLSQEDQIKFTSKIISLSKKLLNLQGILLLEHN